MSFSNPRLVRLTHYPLLLRSPWQDLNSRHPGNLPQRNHLVEPWWPTVLIIMSVLKESKHLRLSLNEIELATNNFNEPIGKGGYGMVYKGELPISGRPTTVAVKRLTETSGQGLKEFLTEIQLLSAQNHKNVISLLGYCDEGQEKTLVYEYAANGSLDVHLRNRNRSLTWQKRLEICLDAARGLNHLHSNSRNKQTIIHRDIKSANILLDQNWVAKIADLGLSKLKSESSEGSSRIVSNACGTPGYCDPGYYNNGILKKECDVYSFGIVLFEVVCGKLCSPYPSKDGSFVLSGPSLQKYYSENRMEDILDPYLQEQTSSFSINKFSEVAYNCLLKDEGKRPSMNYITKVLEGLLFILEIELTSSNEVGSPHTESYALEPVSKLRHEKAIRIFRRFDINRDGVLSREELANFFYATNPQVKHSEEQINEKVDKVFGSYTKFTTGEGLTCDGLLRFYDHGIDYLHDHFETLRLNLKPSNENEASFRLTERYEKVKRILQRFDINKDGCLNRQELTNLLILKFLNAGEHLGKIFQWYDEFIDGEKGLTCDGLFRAYGYGIDNVDSDFEMLHLDLKPFDENQVALRCEKMRRIFHQFDINKDGGLNREELADLIVDTNPQARLKEDSVNSLVDELFRLFKEFIDGEKGITCDGLLRTYDYGIDSLDDHFEMLNLNLKSLDASDFALRTRERFEKVSRIFRRFDINRDGGLDEVELGIFYYEKSGQNKFHDGKNRYVDKMLGNYGEYIDGIKVLTCNGLLQAYEHGVDALDADYEKFGFDMISVEEEEAQTRERHEKARAIFKRFDVNEDGGLNRDEFGLFLHLFGGVPLDDEMLDRVVRLYFKLLGEFVDEEIGVSCDGLMRIFEGSNNNDLDSVFNYVCKYQ